MDESKIYRGIKFDLYYDTLSQDNLNMNIVFLCVDDHNKKWPDMIYQEIIPPFIVDRLVDVPINYIEHFDFTSDDFKLSSDIPNLFLEYGIKKFLYPQIIDRFIENEIFKPKSAILLLNDLKYGFSKNDVYFVIDDKYFGNGVFIEIEPNRFMQITQYPVICS